MTPGRRATEDNNASTSSQPQRASLSCKSLCTRRHHPHARSHGQVSKEEEARRAPEEEEEICESLGDDRHMLWDINGYHSGFGAY